MEGAAETQPWRSVVDAAENAMLVVDAIDTIQYANAAAERMFGYAPGCLNQRPVGVLECAPLSPGAPGVEPPHDPIVSAVFAGDPTARRADGTLVPVTLAVRPLDGARSTLRLVTVADAGERRRARRVQRAEDPRTACATDPRIGQWRFEVATAAVWWSDEVFEIFGLPAGAPLTLADALAALDASDGRRARSLFERALAEGAAYRDHARLVRRDGSTRTIVYGGEVERDAEGTIVAVHGHLHEVSRRDLALRERYATTEYFADRAIRVGIWEFDLRTHTSVWDRNMFALYGIDDPSLEPTFALWTSALHPHDRERAIQEIAADVATGSTSDSEFRVVWQNGEVHTIRSLVAIAQDPDGTPARLIGTDWDITEIRALGDALREQHEALLSSESRYRALAEAMPQLVFVVDADDTLEYVNRRWSEYTGRTGDGARCACAEIFHLDDLAPINAQRALAPHREFEGEARLRRADGAYRWHLMRGVPFDERSADGGRWIITATDIEERKASERMLAATAAELEHLAHHDPLTKLPNRTLLVDRLTQAIAQAGRSGDRVLVFYVDLDRFKAINDGFGHAAGDTVLQQTAARIVRSLRACDTASRIGGDEFIVVCSTNGAVGDAARIAMRILAAVTAPIETAGEALAVEASIGVSRYPQDGNDAETLIRKADAAMYAAKQSGRNTFRAYTEEAHNAVVEAAELDAELRRAFVAGEFVVYYHPIVDTADLRVVGAEALVRWQHPRLGLLAPGEFVALAEERGLITAIGDVVLEDACAMLARLRDAGRDDVHVAVNVSAQQFGEGDFVARVLEPLARYGIATQQLAIEITESVVMANTEATLAILEELRAVGVQLSIDDFGTGYSSLAYIKRFPVRTLKIDRSFVCDIAVDGTDQAIAKTIITLAHSLDMRVIAEGVETQAQLDTLVAFDVDCVQGCLFSSPLPAADFEQYLERHAAGLSKPPERVF